jgi:hypothetical protein
MDFDPDPKFENPVRVEFTGFPLALGRLKGIGE